MRRCKSSSAEKQGFDDLYIDGGLTVQRLLEQDLIDELIVTEIPLLLGGGARLFGSLHRPLGFELVDSQVLLNQLLRKRYRRKRG
jgi:dihydrofolate reductase